MEEKNKIVMTTERKSMKIRPSGRSSDFISPSFGHGCLYDCSYCYMKRHKPEGLTIADNKSVTDILTEINSHVAFTTVEKPNQTHPEYITYDISCNEDFALHRKYHDWKRIFKFFRDHPIAMATLATKTIPYEFLSFNPKGKVRIRMSLMPEFVKQILEPNTPNIEKRIAFAYELIEAGYDVHLNFSPVIYYPDWLKDYEELFNQVNDLIADEHKDKVFAEVIFLTHNISLHERNLAENRLGENLLWNPSIQEEKISEYGGNNVRYASEFKGQWINEWRALHDRIIPWNTIRYIF